MTIDLIILTLPTVVAAILATFLLTSARMKATRSLGIFILFCGLAMSYTVLLRYDKPYNYILDWVLTSFTVLAPISFMTYIKILTRDDSKILPLVLSLPAWIIVVSNLVLYLIMGQQTSIDYFNLVTSDSFSLNEAPLIFRIKRLIGSHLYRTTCILLIGLVGAWSIAKLKDYHIKLAENISNDFEYKGVDIRILFSIACMFAGALIMMYKPFKSGEISTLYLIGSIIVIVALISMFLFGLKQNELGDSISKISLEDSDTEAKAAISDKSSKPKLTVQEKLSQGIQEQIDKQFYLDPKVTIVSMADAMNTNRTYLSQAIHEIYGCSFSDFVNNLRVEHAIELIRDSEGERLLKVIALDSGFLSASTMNHNFVKFKHMSPSEWMRRFL